MFSINKCFEIRFVIKLNPNILTYEKKLFFAISFAIS